MKIFLGLPAIIGIGIGALVVAVGLFLFCFFYFRALHLKRQVLDCDRRFSYLHALLIGQDAQYVKRLEIISRTNLLYVDTHTKFVKRFKEIRDHLDSYTQRCVNDIKDLYYDHKYSVLREKLPEVVKNLEQYETDVNALNNDLLRVIKPEEECRQNSLSLKEKLRRIKQDYYAKQADLTLVNDSFNEIFKYVDDCFEKFEENVEAAQYDDANSILPEVSQIIDELSKVLISLPDLCTMIVNLLPDKLISLENAVDVMTHDHYPLHHLCVKQSIAEIKKEIDILTAKIKQFDVDGVRDRLDDISNQIDEYFHLFDEEKAAREQFEERSEKVYSSVGTIEKNFIKLCNTIPDVSQIFVINEEQHAKINSIQSEINRVGALKRSLDTFIHSSTKQPYSLLLKKMNELDEASTSITSEIDEFNNYLVSLKTDSERAYDLVYSFYKKLVEAENRVADINVEAVTNKYNDVFDHVYELLNSIYKLLVVEPINVEQINKLVSELIDLGNSLFDDGQVYQDHHMMVVAENAILFSNRDRVHMNDVNELVKQAEQFFNNGEFEKSYQKAGEALNRVKAINERKK